MSDYSELGQELENEINVLKATAEGAISICVDTGEMGDQIGTGLNLQLYRVENLIERYAEAMEKEIKILKSEIKDLRPEKEIESLKAK